MSIVKKAGALVDLNVNPCKMCMPMGAVTAAYGVRGCMTILHGSQGCSTYIRRHMATHFNEPIDIASSSLTEEGTVYGGEADLHKGIDNLIRLYSPEVIAVATTCLAETIGEDVPRMLEQWRSNNPGSSVKLIPVSSPGYGGTQFEGYFRMLRAFVENVEMNPLPNGRVNIITGPVSPADMRYLKELVTSFGIDAVFLPDVSQNLDGVLTPVYNRLPTDGTSLEDISAMAGASLSLEISTFVTDDISPAVYLESTYGVPFRRLHLPVGLRDNAALIEELAKFSGIRPPALKEARGRYLDAMIDSHKYNSEGRAVVFGEPDFVVSVVRMCCEEGIVPVVVATGTKCPGLVDSIEKEVADLASDLLVERYTILDDADFGDIERLALENGANVMIGSSDGRRIEEKHGIPLIRCAFPIHDHVGGQRVRMLGWDGSLTFLDRITNALLQAKETGFRGQIKHEFFDKSGLEKRETGDSTPKPIERTKEHPCFSGGCASTNARIHLAVAPKCNISCNYCVRRFDCPNESRPGVTSSVLTPVQALERYKAAKEKLDNLSVVGIAGPGDALADFENTRETLSLIREYDPEVIFCLSTNGLLLPRYADELIKLGVSHVTVTMNAIDPAIGARIYKHVTLDGIVYTGEAAAGVLLSNQLAGIRYLTERGIVVKVNTVLIAGVNDTHAEQVAIKSRELGATIGNIMQMIPVEGSVFGDLPQVDRHTLDSIRGLCSEHIPQMYHCQQCRADAVGKLTEDLSHLFDAATVTEGKGRPKVATVSKGAGDSSVVAKMRIAVASRGGMMVDQHFGQASSFLVYETDGATARYLERRDVETYCSGETDCDDGLKQGKLERAIATIEDCSAVLSLRIGYSPEKSLAAHGIASVATCDRIEDAVLDAARDIISDSSDISENSNEKEAIAL